MGLRRRRRPAAAPPAGRRAPAGWRQGLVAGGAASLATKLLLQPLDTCRTLLQASRRPLASAAGPGAGAGPAYRNLAHCVRGVVARDGPRGLYRGFPAAVAAAAPAAAVFFAVYRPAKARLEALLGPRCRALAPLLAATAGNAAASVVRVPPEVVKQQVQTGLYPSVAAAVRGVAARGGLAGFYRGYYWAQLGRDVPYAAVQLGIYEALKRAGRRPAAAPGGTKAPAGAFEGWWRGAVAGAAACLATGPLDVAKSRLMAQEVYGRGLGRPYRGVPGTLARVWREEGHRAFVRGLAPRLLFKVPASAVFLLMYELLAAHLLPRLAPSPLPPAAHVL